MVVIKFLTGWNAHLLSKSQNITLDNLQITLKEFKSLTERLLFQFDYRDYFYALFQAITYAGLSPFIATHDYCIKILHATPTGTVEMNISPIYHLGLEYPDSYKNKHGKDLDEDAMIGLLAKPSGPNPPPSRHSPYSYGIDAGILFKDSAISHNKKMTLRAEPNKRGLLTIITCDNQTTSKLLTWEECDLVKYKPAEEMQLDDFAHLR